MLYAEVAKLNETSTIIVYTITCPKCGNIKTITATSPELHCKCGKFLGDYILLINNNCVRVSEHINEES